MDIDAYLEQCREIAGTIRRAFAPVPRVAVILGSGLGGLADRLPEGAHLAFDAIPHYPRARVAGHAGRLSAGALGGAPILLQQGRIHYYEGHSMAQVVMLTRALALAGVKILIATNAAGGVAPELRPGDLMRITDHLNLMGASPVAGPHRAEFGDRFPDLSRAYNSAVGEALDAAAAKEGITLHRGVYAAFAGPSYETPAEVRMARTLGASAVGMSTVPETIAAVQMGVKVGAVSCIANSAAGLRSHGVSHAEVLEVTRKASSELARLLISAAPALAAL